MSTGIVRPYLTLIGVLLPAADGEEAMLTPAEARSFAVALLAAADQIQPDHSGVAGERSDSPLCGSMLNEWTCTRVADHPGPHHGCYGSWTTAPTPAVPAPDPANPSAELTTGCAVVPDEAVEAAARADHEFGRLGDDPDWDGLTDTDRDSYRRAAWSYLTAAAPLIVEAALRQRQVEPTPDEAWAQMAELARDAALRTAAVDALRTVAGFIDHAAALPQVPGSIEKARAEGMRRAASLVREHVEKLERGGDQPKPDRGTVTADDHAIVSRATGGRVRSAERVPECEDDDEPTQDDLNALVELIAGRVDQAQRMGAVLLAGTLLDAGYRKVERGGDR